MRVTLSKAITDIIFDYERLLNVEFPWNPEDLSEESPVEGPSEPITLEMITKAITKMASGKAAGP